MAGVNHQVFCGMRQAANPEMRERSLKQLLTRQRKGSQCLVATAQDMLSPSEEVGGAKKGRWRRVVVGWTGWSPGGCLMLLWLWSALFRPADVVCLVCLAAVVAVHSRQ